MDDHFSAEVRNTGWYATDSRRAVANGLIDVIREKRGEKERDDLSEVEAVQMGLRMQPVIGRMFEDDTGIRVRDLDIAGTHRNHSWLRAHCDFETSDGGLLEVKNYNAAVINKYSDQDEPIRLPEADFIQCVHEAAVFDKPHVWFAVLFGGQRFRYWKLDVTAEMKEMLVKRAAEWWAMCQTGQMPDPASTEQARYKWPQDNAGQKLADAMAERVHASLKAVKANIKQLEEQEEMYALQIQRLMGDSAELVNLAGETLVTWKTAKASKRFSADLLKKSMPNIYEQFVIEQPGSRRFLVK